MTPIEISGAATKETAIEQVSVDKILRKNIDKIKTINPSNQLNRPPDKSAY